MLIYELFQLSCAFVCVTEKLYSFDYMVGDGWQIKNTWKDKKIFLIIEEFLET